MHAPRGAVPLWIAVSALALSACVGNNVQGKVDNDKVHVIDAVFIEQEDFYGSDGVILVELSELSDGCEAAGGFWDDLVGATDADVVATSWADHFPEEFWSLQIVIRVDDPDDDLGGEEFSGVDWDELPGDDDEVTASIYRYTDHLDEDYWTGAYREYDDYFDLWYSDGGDMKIHRHVPGERISGVFTTEAADADDGDDAGEITIHFNAVHCPDYEDAYFSDGSDTSTPDPTGNPTGTDPGTSPAP